MLIFLRILFTVITMVLGGYGLITKNFEYQAFMILSLGLMALVMGIQEIQQKQKTMGWFLIIVFAFSFFAVIQSFIY